MTKWSRFTNGRKFGKNYKELDVALKAFAAFLEEHVEEYEDLKLGDEIDAIVASFDHDDNNPKWFVSHADNISYVDERQILYSFAWDGGDIYWQLPGGVQGHIYF